MEDTTSTEHRFIAILGDEDLELDPNAKSADRLELLSPNIKESPLVRRRDLNIHEKLYEGFDPTDQRRITPNRRVKAPRRQKMKYETAIKDLN